MNVILVMVATINGKTTRGTTSGTLDWASPEDQDYFFKTLNDNNLLIMGSKTYEVARPEMKFTPDRLRVVLTSRPEDYATEVIEGQLEFSSDSVRTLLEKLEKRGYKQAILLGGAQTNADFFKDNLVDELWLTLEPKLFGSGNDLLTHTDLELDLKLIYQEKLNDKGTLLLKFNIIY